MKGQIKFINKPEMIETATDEELRNVVITCDGAGEKQKNLVLDEMLKRARKASNEDACQKSYDEGYNNGWDSGWNSRKD